MFKRRLYWVAMNIIFFTVLYMFLFKNSVGAENVITVWVYLLAILSFAYVTDAVKDAIKEKGRTFPAWVGVPLDLAAIIALVWFGHVAMGCALIFHTMMESSAYSEESKP